MIRNMLFYFVFLPHTVLVYFLPPEYPLHFNTGHWDVNWWGFAGKLVDAYPASLVYGLLLSFGWSFIQRKREQNSSISNTENL